MTRLVPASIALCTAVIVLLPDVSAQQTTFRATIDAVAVEASVRDSTRRVITGLQATDFEITDNGVPQEIIDVSYGELPIDVTVGLDVSYSVTGAVLDQLRRAVGQLMQDLARQDRLKLVIFNQRVTRAVDFTGDAAGVDRAVKTVAASGGTSIFDAISVALVSAAPDPDRRQFVIFFTDGADVNSSTEMPLLLEIARRTTATLTMVKPTGLSLAGGAPAMLNSMMLAQQAQTGFLSSLAYETGGSFISPGPRTDLVTTFQQALNAFRSTYVLHFMPKNVVRSGYHTLVVKVRRDNTSVVARRGYMGG